MDMLVLILAIVAVAGTALHAILWHTVSTYRSPLLFHVAALCGCVAVLVLALK
jgi:hypothetical protein